jgi:predicted GNAT family N-acyltransferase
LKVILLDAKMHNRSSFSCEEESLTEYLKKQASQDIKKRLAACFALVDADNHIKGYYTLSNDSLAREEVPEEYQKRIPQNYNVPVTLLGRLARDVSAKGTGLGEHLLLDALFRSYTASKTIASMAVIVDPINEKAVQFYGNYGFTMLPDSGKMFLAMNAIGKLFP